MSDLYGNVILAVVKEKVPCKDYEAELHVVKYSVKICVKKMQNSENLEKEKNT